MRAKYTPGPWGWFGNAKCQDLYLSTVDRGRRFVMTFNRWGTRSGQPAFQDAGRMKPATAFLKFEVGNPEVIGLDAAKADNSVYRLDILDIDHPDARLIRAAPAYAEAWSLLPDEVKRRIFDALHKPGTEWIEAAIREAES